MRTYIYSNEQIRIDKKTEIYTIKNIPGISFPTSSGFNPNFARNLLLKNSKDKIINCIHS